MKTAFKVLNIIFVLVFLACAIIIAGRPSTANIVFLAYSLKRLLLIIFTAAFSAYFIFSIFHKKLAEINAVTFIGLAIAALILEASLWLYPKLYPIGLINYLKSPIRENVIRAHNLKTKGDFVGERLLYRYQPFKDLPMAAPDDNLKGVAIIDENGYRNSVLHQRDVDIVLLGDSLIFGANSPLDIGDFLRKKGFSVLNLAVESYGPQHWRDAFAAFGKQARPQHVFAFLFDGNDFYNAVEYHACATTNKTFVSYLYPSASTRLDLSQPSLAQRCINRSFIFSFIRGLLSSPRFIFENINENKYFKPNKYTITLNGKTSEMDLVFSTPPAQTIHSDGFHFTLEAIKMLNDECREAGAQLTVVYIPSNSTVYAKFSQNHGDALLNEKTISGAIEAFCRAEGIRYKDILTDLQDAITKRQIYLENGRDSHFRPEGHELLAEIVVKSL